MMNNLNQLNNLIKYHLSLHHLNKEDKLWRIEDSPTEGRGILANRDINPGEIIFIDHPLLMGPRSGNNFTLHCVVCCNLSNLHVCTKGCGLPVCSLQCEKCTVHMRECELIRKLSKKIFTEVSSEIFKCLSPLRVFLINEKLQELLKFLTYHSSIIHGNEVDLVKEKITLSESEEHFLKIICSILDTNTFATVVRINNFQISVRALYPLGAFLNHSCCPNVTHLYNNKQQMIVKAAVFIPKDAELFITYTSLLWGTSLRRLTQYVTKHFWCQCVRCKDPKEFGTCLSGLNCISKDCQGIIYSVDPLDNFSDWKCDNCNFISTYHKVGAVHSELGNFLRSVGTKDMEQLIILIKEELRKIVPPKNHVNFEVKVKVIWSLGNKPDYMWKDLSMDNLNLKEQLCVEVLEVLSQLKLGVCKMRGLILYELYRTRFEKYARKKINVENVKLEENRLLLTEAAEILENDVSAPSEIEAYLKSEI